MTMTLGQRIQFHRTRLEFSQEGLGDQLGVSRQAVSKWEADGAVPDTDKLIALSKLFGITLNELLQVEEPVKPDGAGEGSAPEGSLPKAAAPAKPKWKGRLTAVLACLCLILGVSAYTIAFGRMIGAANDRVAELEWEVSLLEGRVKELETRGVGLDPAAPLVSGFDFSANEHGNGVMLTLDLLPYQLPENLTVSFTATSKSGYKSKTKEAVWDDGGHYTAVFALDTQVTPITISALISDGISQYTVSLVKITDLYGYSYSYETLWNQG